MVQAKTLEKAADLFDEKVNAVEEVLKPKFSQTQHSFHPDTGFVVRSTMFYE